MTNNNLLTQIRETIKQEKFIRELVGEEIFITISAHEQEMLRLLNQLAEIIVDILIAKQDNKDATYDQNDVS